jgi:hypothetical protein
MDYQEPPQDAISRKGYLLKDLSKNFIQVLSESGAVAIGKICHFASDLICSSGLELLQKLCWDYAYDHIGTASPRIFYYLRKKFAELNEKNAKLNLDQFCRSQEVQQQVMECVLILQMCPKKTKVKYPTVPQETHQNENWLRGVLRTTDKAAVRKVWQRNTDQEQMLHAGNEMVFAITEGAPERALFWVKWLQEEDAIVKKAYGTGLSTAERGPATSKNRSAMGYYLINVLTQLYKEMATTGQVRLHEEYQSLIDLYRDHDTSQKHRNDLIGIMVQLLCEVPKWKVPACPSLVKDPATLQRIVESSGQFFDEILRLPPVKPLPAKVTGLHVKKTKDKSKQTELEERLAAIDAATMSFLKM